MAAGSEVPAYASAGVGAPQVPAPADRSIVLTRVLNAPRHLVFDALTRPELLRHWIGPRGWPLIVCVVDLKVGGAYRFVARSAAGNEIEWAGSYREIVPPRRLVRTERFDDDAIGEALVITTLTQQACMTTLRCEIRFVPSGATRDCPMRRGAMEGYDRLAEFSTSTLAAHAETEA